MVQYTVLHTSIPDVSPVHKTRKATVETISKQLNLKQLFYLAP